LTMHILHCNGYFYYRISIPFDLKYLFPFRHLFKDNFVRGLLWT
jgi:hypothetical protein